MQIQYQIFGRKKQTVRTRLCFRKIHWDVVGLSEVKKEGTNIIKTDKHILMYHGEKSDSNGIGFTNFIALSNRVARLAMTFDTNIVLNIIQVYATTNRKNKTSQEQLEIFYEDVSTALQNSTRLVIVILVLRSACPNPEDVKVMGNWVYTRRKNRDNTLLNFLRETQLYIMNSHFKMKFQFQ